MSLFDWIEENINEPIGDFFEGAGDAVGNVFGSITGQNQADAALEAAQIQADAATAAAAAQGESTQQQIAAQQAAAAQQRQDLQPFTEFGASFMDPARQAIDQSQQLFTDPSSIMSNPFLQALQGQAQTNILQNQAVRGRLGTGETPQFLQDAAMRTGFDFLNQERAAQLANVARLQSLVGGGQSAAAGQGQASVATGANIGNTLQQGVFGQNQLTTDAAAANAAGVVGAANATGAGAGNILSLGSMLFGAPTVGAGLGGTGAATGTGSTINSPFAFGGA